jgi:predicted transcriptional regulator of viral defense system
MKNKAARNLAEFVDSLQASGRYTFLREEAIRVLGCTALAFKGAARRLQVKARIVAPRRGFYVIVPVEYRTVGAPPPSWFIDDLMRFHGHPYYVGLLSAAALYGAAHQQPQEFQVVTDVPLRSTSAGRTRIRFFTKHAHTGTPTVEVKTDTGTMRTATPEATAFDLLRYVRSAGGLGNVATVLAELSERIKPDDLLAVARAEVELAYSQRLGYLLELIAARKQAKSLAKWIAACRPTRTPLRAGKSMRGFPLNQRWQVILNEEVEVDL